MDQRRASTVVGVTLLLAAVLGVVRPPAVSAHETASSITPVVDELVPDVGGVEVFVQSSQDATLLTVVPAADVVVEVLDADGMAWARVTPGRVEVDLGNPSYHAGTNPRGVVPDDLGGDPGSFTVVGNDDRFQWFEHRLHPDGLDVDADILASPVEQDVAQWEVPLRVDGVDTAVQGRLRHVPRRGSLVPRLVGDREVTDGVTVDVVPGPVPGFFLSSTREEPVTVLSREGVAYVVLDPAGARVNVASRTWAEQVTLGNVAAETVVVDSAPVFEAVSSNRSHTWLDTRAALPGILPSADVRASGEEVVVRRWTIPLEVGGEVLAVEGQTVWVPLVEATEGDEAAGGVRWDLVVAGVAGVGLLAVLVQRRRGA